jgi:hypothetical protein
VSRPPEGDQLSSIRSTILGAVTTKPPMFVDETRQEKVDRLEQYMLNSAVRRAEIEECLFLLTEMNAVLSGEWEDIQGWEHLPVYTAKPTVATMNQAKRAMRSDLYDSISEVKRLKDHCERIIARFEHEEKVVISRAFTMISGR